MPEGHTIRALGNRWQSYAGDRFTVLAPNARVQGSEALNGQPLSAVDVLGKHLFLLFGVDTWLHVHLGRFGKFYWHEQMAKPLPEAAPTVRLRFVSDRVWVDLIGSITNTLMDLEGKRAIEEKLGPDPLRAGSDPERALARIQTSKRPIGELLMDQHVLAGVGNIYRAELLWRNQLSPYRPGAEIDSSLFDQLWEDAKLLLQQGVTDYQEGQPTHTLGLPLPDGSSPVPEVFGRRNRTQAYQRAGLACARDGHAIQQADMAGRTLFYCPQCQV